MAYASRPCFIGYQKGGMAAWAIGGCGLDPPLTTQQSHIKVQKDSRS